ncbi:MAG: ATP-binding protein [Spirochaetales bacterium]|nr:ATP-binding protein [Spirochaetales bacterium]
MYIRRAIETAIKRAVKTFPAIVVTGPRQSGKTTLLKNMFPSTHKFITLENPDIREMALEDPNGFLKLYSPPVIFDEIQYAPDLLSYIKTKIDNNRKPGLWLFTGSQSFALMQGISESLAGRAAVFNLYPLSLAEINMNSLSNLTTADFVKKVKTPDQLKIADFSSNITIADWILRGGYPELALNYQVDRDIWSSSYATTYLERDVRQIINVTDLNLYNKFLRMCATFSACILNESQMANTIGISIPTVKRWLSVLITGGIIFLLSPYFKNIGKRLIKRPKLYFVDTALASFLLGIHEKEILLSGPSFGNLFETAVISDFLKRFFNHGISPSLYYIRTQDGLETDLVIDINGKLYLFEIKSSSTLRPKHTSALKRWTSYFGNSAVAGGVIGCQDEYLPLSADIHGIPWKALAL